MSPPRGCAEPLPHFGEPLRSEGARSLSPRSLSPRRVHVADGGGASPLQGVADFAAESFTALQLAQLRSVVRDAVEDTVKDAICAEFEKRAGQFLWQGRQGSRSASKKTIDTGGSAPAQEPANGNKDGTGKPFEGLEGTASGTSEASKASILTKCNTTTLQAVSEIVHGKDRTSALSSLTSTHDRIRYRARELVHGSHKFDAVMSCIIVANCVIIALETQFRVENRKPGYLFWMETTFLTCFVAELLVRWIADTARNLYSGWFWFDVTLVVTGMISTWLIDPLGEVAASLEDVPFISQVLALRVLRLFRLVRALRLMEQFKELWKLCSGLLKSSGTMLSVTVVVLVAIFVFACLGVDVITFSETLARNPETDEIVKRYFYSLPMIMLTLMQFSNADSIAAIYMPLCREQPFLVIYFLALWLVVTVALMNLVTAIIVESAMGQGREDEEERRHELRKVLKRILPEIEQVFDNLDEDGSGSLGIGEIEEAARNGALVLPEGIKDYVMPDRLRDVFDFLDVDQSGEIDKAEFVDGVCSLVVSAVPIETTQILQLLRHSHMILMETRETVGRIRDREIRRDHRDNRRG